MDRIVQNHTTKRWQSRQIRRSLYSSSKALSFHQTIQLAKQLSPKLGRREHQKLMFVSAFLLAIKSNYHQDRRICHSIHPQTVWTVLLESAFSCINFHFVLLIHLNLISPIKSSQAVYLGQDRVSLWAL